MNKKFEIRLDNKEIENTVSETIEFYNNILEDKDYRKKIEDKKSSNHKEMIKKFRSILDEIDNI